MKLFSRWLGKHCALKAKFDAVSMRHCHTVKVHSFDVWRYLARQCITDSKMVAKFQSKWVPRKKRQVLKCLSAYAKDREERTQMKMVSQYYFIRKVLVRTLEGWRQNVKADAMVRVKEVNKSQTVLTECFNAFKKNYYGG